MPKEIDARGKPCPEPVILTRKALADADVKELVVLVDNAASAENVAAMARNNGCEVVADNKSDGAIALALTRTGEAASPADSPAEEDACGLPANIVVLFNTDTFGRGDDKLGSILIRGFIKTLYDVVPRPAKLVFVNGGVKLTTSGSELVPDISRLETAGTEVLSCGTCLDYYGLMDKLEVGRISNMLDITTVLMTAERIIKP